MSENDVKVIQIWLCLESPCRVDCLRCRLHHRTSCCWRVHGERWGSRSMDSSTVARSEMVSSWWMLHTMTGAALYSLYTTDMTYKWHLYISPSYTDSRSIFDQTCDYCHLQITSIGGVVIYHLTSIIQDNAVSLEPLTLFTWLSSLFTRVCCFTRPSVTYLY